MNFKCYFVITPKFFECLHFEVIKSVYSEPVVSGKYPILHIEGFSSKQELSFFRVVIYNVKKNDELSKNFKTS